MPKAAFTITSIEPVTPDDELPPMTEAEQAKDRELARRIDELAVLWKTFTPPKQGSPA
jgi:hypothetical protein